MASPKKGPSAPADDKTTTNPHTFVLDILIRILQLLLSLTILVTIHELGHYLAAKAFGARVDKFYIFFNPRFSLFKKKIGETEYGIGWLPLGGYCKIAGMVDESMDTEALKSEPQPWEYRSKPAWQRLIIIVAGVVMNVLLAWFIYSMMTYKYGETYIATRDVKDGIAITDSTLASTIGLRPGDRIVSVDGKEYENFFDTYSAILLGSQLTVQRQGRDTTLTIPVDFIDTFKDYDSPYFYYPRVPMIVAAVPDSSINAHCGLRPGEGRALKKKHINLDTGEVFITDTKFDKDRLIVMSDDMLSLCRKYDAVRAAATSFRQSEYFFPAPGGNCYSRNAFSQMFQQCWKAANPGIHNLPRVRVYDLRHRFASAVLNRCTDEKRDLYAMLPYLRAYMGHYDLSATEHYIHLLPDNLVKSSGVFWAAMESIIPEVEENE